MNWCGGAPTAVDRPDIDGGNEIHVIYASPSDSPDRFTQVASAIATDVRAINLWWRGQDPTRSRVPRWDFAQTPSCGGFGALDISDVKLPHDTAYYNGTQTPRLALLRDDLVAAGFNDPSKKYLVYYDQATASTSTECGSAYVSAQSGSYAGVFIAPNLESSVPGHGCGSIEPGSPRGGYLAVVAAHELVNSLGALDDVSNPGPPHKCPGDPLHVCDNSLDILAPTPTATSIGKAILDFGHDDYYAHSGSWWDVQDSAWLIHVNERQATVSVTVGTGGEKIVDTNQPGMSCASGLTCPWTWTAGSALALAATAAPGYSFVSWRGCPSPSGANCVLTVGSSVHLTANFAPPLRVAAFHLAFTQAKTVLTATVHLNVAGQANQVTCMFGGQAAASASVRGTTATCSWTVQSRFRGHRIKGSITLAGAGNALLSRQFHVDVPAK